MQREAHFGNLRAISSSSCKPHLNLALIRAILNGWSSNIGRSRSGLHAQPAACSGVESGETPQEPVSCCNQACEAQRFLSSLRAWRQLQRQRSRRVRRPGHIPHLGRGRHLRHIQRLLSVQPLPRERPRHASPRRASCRKHRKRLLLRSHPRRARRHRRTALRHSSSRVLPVRRPPRGRRNEQLSLRHKRDGNSKVAITGTPTPRGRAAAGSVRPCGAGKSAWPGVATAQHQQGGVGSHLAQRGLCQQTRQRRAQCPRAGTIDIPRAVLRSRMAAASVAADRHRLGRTHVLALCVR